MADTTNGSESPNTNSAQFRYRLNPHHFLADRSAWVIVGILTLLMAYGLAIHVIAFSVGLASGSQRDYWLSLIPLIFVPIGLQILVRRSARRTGQTIASLSKNGTTWMVGESGVALHAIQGNELETARDLVEHLKLPDTSIYDIVCVWQELPLITSEVQRHAATIMSREIPAIKDLDLRVIVTSEVGASHVRPAGWGKIDIVLPLGAGFAPLMRWSQKRKQRNVRSTLAHELSHVFVQRAPKSILSDIRLMGIAAAMENACRLLIVATLPALLFAKKLDLSGGSTILPLVMTYFLCGGMVAALPLRHWVQKQIEKSAELARFRRKGPAAIVSITLGYLPCMIAAGLGSRVGLFAQPEADAAGTNWLYVLLSIGVVVPLARLCVIVGRHQVEHIADEHAVAAIAEYREKHTDVRLQMAQALRDVHGAIVENQANERLPPAHALGHYAYHADSSLIFRNPRSLTPANTSTTFWARIVNVGLKVESQLHALVVMFRSPHVTLKSRIAALEYPDLQIEQDPSIPLIYATLPIVVFPYLARKIAGSASSPLLGSLLLPIIAIFLALFAMVARRPTRRTPSVDHSRASDMASGVGPDQPATTGGGMEVLNNITELWNTPLEKSSFYSKNMAILDVQPPRAEPLDLIGELWIAFRSLLIASILGIISIAMVEALRGGSIKSAELPILFLKLPPLAIGGSVIVIASLFVAWYLVLKFASLSQWHYYSGTSWPVNLFHQTINWLKSFFLACFILGLVAILVALLGTTKAILLPGVGMSWFRDMLVAWFAGRTIASYAAAVWVTVSLTFALSYASVVHWWPSIPRTVQCPLGHNTPMRWRSLLRRPDTEAGADWGWLRCDTCGRAPHAERHLLCDQDRLAPSWQRGSNRWVLLVGILGISQLALPVWILSGRLALLDVVGRCKNIQSLQGLEQTSSTIDCNASLPEPPADNALLSPQADAVRLQSLHGGDALVQTLDALAEESGQSALIPIQLELSWTCGEWLAHVRNEVAYVQACAQTPPGTIQNGGLEIQECLEDGLVTTPEKACRCLWAATMGANASGARDKEDKCPPASASSKTAAVLAARRLYGIIHALLHDGASTVCDQDEKTRAAWKKWHEHIEMDLAQRLFAAVSKGCDPDKYLHRDKVFDGNTKSGLTSLITKFKLLHDEESVNVSPAKFVQRAVKEIDETAPVSESVKAEACAFVHKNLDIAPSKNQTMETECSKVRSQYAENRCDEGQRYWYQPCKRLVWATTHCWTCQYRKTENELNDLRKRVQKAPSTCIEAIHYYHKYVNCATDTSSVCNTLKSVYADCKGFYNELSQSCSRRDTLEMHALTTLLGIHASHLEPKAHENVAGFPTSGDHEFMTNVATAAQLEGLAEVYAFAHSIDTALEKTYQAPAPEAIKSIAYIAGTEYIDLAKQVLSAQAPEGSDKFKKLSAACGPTSKTSVFDCFFELQERMKALPSNDDEILPFCMYIGEHNRHFGLRLMLPTIDSKLAANNLRESMKTFVAQLGDEPRDERKRAAWIAQRDKVYKFLMMEHTELALAACAPRGAPKAPEITYSVPDGGVPLDTAQVVYHNERQWDLLGVLSNTAQWYKVQQRGIPEFVR